jgi:hypothetical protein
LHVFLNQCDDAAKNVLQRDVSYQETANTLEKTELLFGALKAQLQFFTLCHFPQLYALVFLGHQGNGNFKYCFVESNQVPHPDSSWRESSSAFAVHYSLELLEEINRLAVEGFYAFRRGGLEVGGLLFGRRTSTGVEVLAHEPVPCEHALGPGFRLSASDRSRFDDLLEQSRAESRFEGLDPVGIYRSVTRRPLELSDEDAELAAAIQQESRVILILRPDAISPTKAAFFCFGPDGLRADTAEITLGMGRPQSPEFTEEEPAPPVQEWAEPPASIQPDVPTVEQPVRVRVVRRVSTKPPRMRHAVRLVAALLMAGALWWLFAREAATLGLTLADRSGQVHVEWNRAAVADARRGWIEIRDGASRIRTEFSPSELTHGSLYFLRRSDRTEVRMVIEAGDGRHHEESATVVGR